MPDAILEHRMVGTAGPRRNELAHDPLWPGAGQQELHDPFVRVPVGGDLPTAPGLLPDPGHRVEAVLALTRAIIKPRPGLSLGGVPPARVLHHEGEAVLGELTHFLEGERAHVGALVVRGAA